MKSNINYIYKLELFILAFIATFFFIMLSKFSGYGSYLANYFWIIPFLILWFKMYFFRETSYLKRYSINIVIICILSMIIVMYSLGMITGYAKSVFKYDLIHIVKNIFPYIFLVITQEYIRYTIAKNSETDKKPIIFITILFIVFDIMMSAFYYQFVSLEKVFVFSCVRVVPIIAKELLFSYISYKCCLTPTLILRFAMETYIFIFPFYPIVSEYIEGMFGVLFPFIIYLLIRKGVHYHMKGDLNTHKYKMILILIPLFLITLSLLILISGIFTYKLVAIGSNSMKGVYSRGDAVIYRQIKDIKEIDTVNKGDILVFVRNEVVITHRVIKITEENGKKIYYTKGDNNKNPDRFSVSQDDVLGVVTYKINYIGYPTILLGEVFNGKNRGEQNG